MCYAGVADTAAPNHLTVGINVNYRAIIILMKNHNARDACTAAWQWLFYCVIPISDQYGDWRVA